MRQTLILALVPLLTGLGCVTPAARMTAPPKDGDGFQYVDVGDAYLRVRATGPSTSNKTPVVLVHGFGARLDNWRAVQDALDDDRLVVSFDQKGFGESERPDGAYGPDKHGDDVLRVMDALHIKEAILAGHSYGGGVVMRALVKAPDRVRGMVLVDALILEEQIPTSFRWAKAPGLGEAIFSVLFKELPGEKYVMAFQDGQRFASAKVLDEVHALQARDGSTFAQLETVRGMSYQDAQRHYRDALGDMPRVVIWGDTDRVLPPRQGRAVAAAIDAPLVVAADCGHVPPIERPRLVIDAIADVAARADAAPRTTRALHHPEAGGAKRVIITRPRPAADTDVTDDAGDDESDTDETDETDDPDAIDGDDTDKVMP